IETIPALKHLHNYSKEWTVDKEATCTEVGSKSHHCLGCDDKSDVTNIPATGHSYGNWKTTKEPTEETTGLKERECSSCHHKETETLPALNHTHSYSDEWTIDKEATCTEAGSKSHHCLDCDDRIDITVISATGHNYGQLISKVDKTCTKSGKEAHYICSECDTYFTIEKETIEEAYLINPASHNIENHLALTPTCTEEGWDDYAACKDCDYTTKEIIEALGHNYGNWKTTKEPTETSTGLKERECGRCHHKETETLPMLEHTHNYSDEWTIDKEATCITIGSKSHHCLGCADKKDVTEISIVEHTYDQQDICEICGHIKVDGTEGLTYRLNNENSEYIVTGIENTTETNIIVPTKYKGLPVTSIDRNAFLNCSNLN
ncbi:MAG: hypothetical protein K2H06_03945, partial [Anaeroplasmataceae bacterium]|nr:hypothetical protein [Anaeroplasmataceae bacterium]